MGAANCLISPEGESLPSAATAVMGGMKSSFISSCNLELDLLLPEQEIIPRVNGANNNKKTNNFFSILKCFKNQIILFLYSY